MAFILPDSAEWRALTKLEELGLNSEYITDFQLELPEQKHIEDNVTKHNFSPQDVIPLATFVQYIDATPDKGWKICFHSLYNIHFPENPQQHAQTHCLYQTFDPSQGLPSTLPKDSNPKPKGTHRGSYRLDPHNTYTPAKRVDPIFINRIVVTEEEIGITTGKLLRTFLNKKGLDKDAIVYELSKIPPSTFNRLINNHNSIPKKEILFKIGIILNLTLDEMTELLESAGYAFNPSDKRDIVVKKCFEKKVFNIIDINNCLSNNNVKLMEFGNFDRLNR